MKRSRRTRPTRRRTSTRSSSTRCWRCRSTANAGARHWLDVVRYGEDNPGQHHEPAVSARVAVSRLGHRGPQQGCAVRPVRQAAARGRSDARHVATRHARAGPDRARPAGSQRRAPVDRRRRHAATERLGRAARYRDPRSARLVGGVRALPRSQVRSDPADGLRAADERVRVDVARAAPVLRDRSEDRNAVHVGVSADVRPALHGEPARGRSGIEARAGGACR